MLRYLFEKAAETHNWANRTFLTNQELFSEKQQAKKRSALVVYENQQNVLRNAVAKV